VAVYRSTADSSVVAQELGAQQIEYFFDTVINNLRTQAEDTSQITQQLADQQQLARETTRQLTQLSTDNYTDILDSVFSFYQGGTSRTQRRAEEAQRRVEGAEARTEEAERSRSEATENQGGGNQEGDTTDDAVRHPLSTWVRTSGRSKVRGRTLHLRGGLPGEGRVKLPLARRRVQSPIARRATS
jgi:hypothetical protein